VFDPYDPIDPLGVENVPYEMQGMQNPQFDPGFQDSIRRADDQVLRRAQEQAMLDHPLVYNEISDELMKRDMRRANALEEERILLYQQTQPSSFNEEYEEPISSQQSKSDLSEEEKFTIIFQLLATTIIPLEIVESNDYNHHCKYCDSEVRPFAEGPHHDPNCQRHGHILQISTADAHDKRCKHCSARPFVAGFHHKPDCPRAFPAIPTWKVTNGDYKHKCKHCNSDVRPISEGPHHDEKCSRHASIPYFHTDTAHEYHCTYCDARPFTAGPHHREDCRRHESRIAIPAALLTQGD